MKTNQSLDLLTSSIPEALTPDYWDLPTPLIPTPIVGLEMIEDIYCVGLSPMERWRSYIDATNWDPKQYHDKLLSKRAYHARIVYEMILLESYMNSTWLSTASLHMIRDIAYLELRTIEIEIMSFQLTCGMLGINSEKKNDRALYECSLEMYLLVMWLTDAVQGKNKTKEQHKTYSEVVQDMKPSYSDSPKQKGKLIDKLIYAIQEFLKRSAVMLDSVKDREIFYIELSSKLKKCIICFDKIAVIL